MTGRADLLGLAVALVAGGCAGTGRTVTPARSAESSAARETSTRWMCTLRVGEREVWRAGCTLAEGTFRSDDGVLDGKVSVTAGGQHVEGTFRDAAVDFDLFALGDAYAAAVVVGGGLAELVLEAR